MHGVVRLFAVVLFASAGLALPSANATADMPRIAIIIDDMGNAHTDAAVFELKDKITLGILPHTPHAARYAQQAQELGHEVLVHLPMEAVAGNKLGPGGLTRQMPEAEFRTTLQAALASLPTAVGVNNHMGSLLTAETEPMQWLMAELAERQLYFIDSRTTVATQAELLARQYGLPTNRRHVFIDHESTEVSLEQQFDALVAHAERHGSAIAIGHPYPTTVAMLKRRLPELKARGIELVFASTLTQAEPIQAVCCSKSVSRVKASSRE